MTDFRKSQLSERWKDKLNDLMEEHYPDVIGQGLLVDAWEVGATEIFGVYQCGEEYLMCSFQDYGEKKSQPVRPIFTHTGWRR